MSIFGGYPYPTVGRHEPPEINAPEVEDEAPAAYYGVAGHCRDCDGSDPCPRCGSCCECYCCEPLSGDQAYTGICQGCGGYEECYCREDDA